VEILQDRKDVSRWLKDWKCSILSIVNDCGKESVVDRFKQLLLPNSGANGLAHE
jgi:hypothetical protein